MRTNQHQFVHALLQVGGAMTVYEVWRTPPAQRLGRGVALAMVAVALAEMLDGSRGTAELLRGAAAALRELT